ncbi:Y+L amino acid transporter 2-like [Branchiostoma lanceolatum]|uniref:Y+L amino acid transporter 2-like n=1 Tax=Branchiostoma lanceolatum TaxID=7740 RepID=UPI0034533107
MATSLADQEGFQNDEAREPLNRSSSTDDDDKSVSLKRKISLFNATTLIVGGIIGGGIFISPKGVLAGSGSIGVSLIVWAACGVFSLVGSLCYLELGFSIPKSGAGYAYILEGFGELLAFLFLWVEFLIRNPVSEAISALTFATYVAQPFFPTCETPNRLKVILAALCILILTFINGAKVRWGTRVIDLFTVAKMIALVIIVVAGFVMIGQGSTQNFQSLFSGVTVIGGVAQALYSGLYAYAGWDAANYVIEEIVDPLRNMPRAIFGGLAIVTTTYMLTNVAYYAVLTKAEVLGVDAVAVAFAHRTLGVMAWCIPVFVAMSTFGTLNGTVLQSSRMFFVGSREGHLPVLLSMVHVTRFTPLPAVLTTGILSTIMLLFGDVYTLINYYSFIRWASVGTAVAALLFLRWSKPDMPRPYKTPLIFPILFFLACVFLVVIQFYTDPYNPLIGIALMLSGLPFYFLCVRRKDKPKPKWLARVYNPVVDALQKLLQVCPPEKPPDF